MHLIDRVLSTSRYIVADQRITQPKIDTSQLPKAIFWWKTIQPIKLHSGERISVRDHRFYLVAKPSTILETYHTDYQLLAADDHVIFRFCTHGVPIEGHEAAHIHDDRGNIIEEGDARLNGESLVGVDFLLFFNHVYSYLDEGKCPWQ